MNRDRKQVPFRRDPFQEGFVRTSLRRFLQRHIIDIAGAVCYNYNWLGKIEFGGETNGYQL